MTETIRYKKYKIQDLLKLPSSMDGHFTYEDKPEDIVKMVHKKIKDYAKYWKPQHDKMEVAMRYLSNDQWRAKDRESRDFLMKPSGNFPLLQGIRDNIYHSSMIPSLTVRINAKDLKGEDFSATTSDATFISDDTDRKFTTAQFYQGFVNSILYSSNCADHFNKVLARSIDYGFGGYLLMYVDKVDEFSEDDELEIKFQHNMNPFSFLMDPTTRNPDFSDMNFFIDRSDLTKKEAIAIYGKKSCFETSADGEEGDVLHEYIAGTDEKMVRIIDVWERRRIDKKVVKLKDGDYMFYDDYLEAQAELQVIGNPAVGKIMDKTFWQVRKYCICKDTLLGKAEIIPGFNHIPIYPMVGKSYDIKNKDGSVGIRYRGLTELAHDAQHAYNVCVSNIIDKAGRNTNNLFNFGGDVKDENRINRELQFSGPRVVRTPKGSGGIVPITNGTLDPEDVTIMREIPEMVKIITGVSHAAMGERANEISARALKAQKQQSDSGLLVYPRQSSMVVRRMAEDIITNARIIYKKGRTVFVEDENGKTVPVTIGGVSEIVGDDGNVTQIFDNDIDRDPKLDVVVEHNIMDESRRDQFNNTITEISQKTNDASIQAMCAAQIVKNTGAPGAARIASKILMASGNPDMMTPDEMEHKVRDDQEKTERMLKLKQEGFDISQYDPEQQEPPIEYQIEQLKLKQEETKLKIMEAEAKKEEDMADVELKTAVANAEGQTAAARQKMAAADLTRESVKKEQIQADKTLAELNMKLRKEGEDVEQMIEEKVLEILEQYFSQSTTNQ